MTKRDLELIKEAYMKMGDNTKTSRRDLNLRTAILTMKFYYDNVDRILEDLKITVQTNTTNTATKRTKA